MSLQKNSLRRCYEKVKNFLKRYYNGYYFNKQAESVYNPMMVLSCLKSITKYNRYPELPADQNIRVDYNQVAYIFGKNDAGRDEVIREMTDNRRYKFEISQGRTFNLRDYKSGRYIPDCLYYLGLLTYGKSFNEFVIPNLVTYEMVLSYFERIMNFETTTVKFDRIVTDFMESGNMEEFARLFFEEGVRLFPGDFFKDVNESFYRGLFFHVLYSVLPANLYEVYPEFNLPGGTVDLFLRSREVPEGLVLVEDLVEIKRVPASASDSEFKVKFKEAKSQVTRYRSGEFKEFRAVAICFRGNKDYKIEVF